VIREDAYGLKADVFSFGMVLCELVAGFYPFKRNGKGKPSVCVVCGYLATFSHTEDGCG